jgi:hypothetical protein
MVNKFRFNQDKYQMMEKKEISKMEETMNSYNAKVCLSLKFVLYFSPWKALINDSFVLISMSLLFLYLAVNGWFMVDYV